MRLPTLQGKVGFEKLELAEFGRYEKVKKLFLKSLTQSSFFAWCDMGACEK
jgi:hypothetical protein